MRVQHPWAFLLAQMAFTKEAWEAERVSGGIAFESSPRTCRCSQSAPRVEVVVALVERRGGPLRIPAKLRRRVLEDCVRLRPGPACS